MTIPPEAWQILLGLALAFGYWLKRRGDAQTEEEKAGRIAAESQLMKAQSESDGQAFIRQQFLWQIKINEQMQQFLVEKEAKLVEKEAKDEANYRVIRNVQLDINAQLINLLNAIRGLNIKVDQLPSKIAAANDQTKSDGLPQASNG